MQEKFQRAIGDQAAELGLLPDEVNSLIGLCDEARYWSPEELYAISANLADRYPGHTSLDTIGYGADPERRRIERFSVGAPTPDGRNVYAEAPGHASERLGSTTAVILQQLCARHPDILARFGYDSLVCCNNIDPDGTALQAWTELTLEDFFLRGYRGAVKDQICWGYPIEGYTTMLPEVQASLDMLSTYNPAYFASLHSAIMGAYHRVSRQSDAMHRHMVRALEGMDIVVNYTEPESPADPALAPGVFPAGNRQTLERDIDAAEDEHHLRTMGTSALDYVSPEALMHIPEVAWTVPDFGGASPDAPSGVNKLQAIRHRNRVVRRIIDDMQAGMARLEPWASDTMHQPAVRRLYDAAAWYQSFVPPFLEADEQRVRQAGDNKEELTRFQYAWSVGFYVCGSLVYMGNVHRLATMAAHEGVAHGARETVRQGLAEVGPTRSIPIARQAGAQVLSVVSGMRYASETTPL